jgi:polysaccharide transporter, PST family
MISRIKSFIHKLTSTQERRVLLGNFFSLSFLQAANYILPLITLPYLVRVLGPDKYGLIAFAQSFMQYFLIITDYGFLMSATREISVNRDNKKRVSEIFSAVTVIKLALLVISLCLMLLLVATIPKFKHDWIIYVFSFGIVLDSVLFPVWFFQGMERMKYITIRNVAAKLIFTVAIFVFIRKQADYLLVPLINSLGFIIAGILGFWTVFKHFGVHITFPSAKEIKYHLKEGWHIFISKIAISLYTTSNTFILGLFTNNTVVGYYAAGEKIVRAIIAGFDPMFRTVYPHISKSAAESKERTIVKLRKIFKLSFTVSFCIFVFFFIFADKIVRVLLGTRFSESIIIIKILSPLLFIIPGAYIFSNLGILPFKLDKYFSRIYISGGVLNLAILFIFLSALKMQGEGVAWASLLTESIIAAMLYFVLLRNRILIFSFKDDK